jgi:hypothetical protein
MKGVRRYAVVGCMAAMAGGAWAGALAPTKASQVVTLATAAGAPTCPFIAAGKVVDSLQKPDATTASFSIPLGSVLVITEAEIAGWNATSAGDRCEINLALSTATTENFLATHEGLCDASGRISGMLTFPTGAVVKPGTTICAVGFDDTTVAALPGTFAVVHGFLASDK